MEETNTKGRAKDLPVSQKVWGGQTEGDRAVKEDYRRSISGESHFKKNPGIVELKAREKYLLAKKFLEENRTLTVRIACTALKLGRSSYYAAKKAKVKNDLLDKEVWDQILKLWETFPGIGYRKIKAYLGINGKRVQRILRKYRGLRVKKPRAKSQRKFPNLLTKITKDLIKHPEKLARGNWILKDGKNGYRKLIEPTRPYQLWAGDWKEFGIPVIGMKIYIFAIIDVYTRQLKGYSFSLIKDTQSALAAARMAIEGARDDALCNFRRLIMHSDQGGPYVSNEYIAYWQHYGVHMSLTDAGKPTQNPYIEAFFSILVRFWINQNEFISAIDVEDSLAKFFRLYNTKWKHSRIDYVSRTTFFRQILRINRVHF